MIQAHRLFVGFATATVVLICLKLSFSPHMGPRQALIVTQNTLKDLQNGFFCLGGSRRCSIVNIDREKYTETEGTRDVSGLLRKSKNPGFWNREIDPGFSNMVNSVFPIDSIISYNETNDTNTEFVARYASFSPILNHEIRGNYAFVAGSACSEIDSHLHPEYKGKVLIVQRGKCSFVKKLHHITGANLDPLAVVVANNVPRSGLITMYSRTFNRDDELHFPVLFMSYEDSQELQKLPNPNIEIAIRTASFDGFIGLVLSMAVSPPLMILVCFLIIRGTQMLNRRRRNRNNQKFVDSLPVHIYNRTHLIPTSSFYEYLVQTNQTRDIPSVQSSTDDISAAHEPENGVCSTGYVVGGTDLYSLPRLHLLFADKDFYATQKCSICLGRYVPLKSRVLVLQCKHVYHEKCLSNWLINFKKTCPLCNKVLAAADMRPLAGHDHADYGTFAPDTESQSNRNSSYIERNLDNENDRERYIDIERQSSNIAVRSLHMSSIVSGNDSSTRPLLASNELFSASSRSLNSEASIDSRLLDHHASNSNSSFVTTKTQQSAVSSRMSSPSSYHTSTSTNSEGDDTQSYESSRSTLRF